MKNIIKIIILVLLAVPSIAQRNYTSKLIRTDSIRGRVSQMNMVNLNGFTITVNDTLIEDYITAKSSGGGFALTNGNGTTANATSVDLGGNQSGTILINSSSAASTKFHIDMFDLDISARSQLIINNESAGGNIETRVSNDLNKFSSFNITPNFFQLRLEPAFATTKSIFADESSDGIRITDAVTNIGLVYANDYSANFTTRTLIDKGYGDTNYMGLGGTFNQTGNILLEDFGTNNAYSFSIESDDGLDATKFYQDNARIALEGWATGENFPNELIDIDTQTGAIITQNATTGAFFTKFNFNGLFSDNRVTTAGIQYLADYSAGFSARSLIDKGYGDANYGGGVQGAIADNQIGVGNASGEIESTNELVFDGNSLFLTNSSGNSGIHSIASDVSSDAVSSSIQSNVGGTGDSYFEARVIGAAGDPYIKFGNAGAADFSFALGADQSDGDKLKITYNATSNNSTPSSANVAMTIDPLDGVPNFPNGISANITGAAAQIFKTVFIDLTAAQIDNMNATPVLLVPPPGAGKVLTIINVACSANFNTTAFTGTTVSTVRSVGGVSTYSSSNAFLKTSANLVEEFDSSAPVVLLPNQGLEYTCASDVSGGDTTFRIFVTYSELTL